MPHPTPAELGYRFPAEFEPHEATWLSWPHKEASWPGKLERVYPSYIRFISHLAASERVCINVNDAAMQQDAEHRLRQAGVQGDIRFYLHPSNDAWCRDHGPAFVLKPGAQDSKAVVDWGYNAWGGKYPPFELDDFIPTRIAQALHLPVFYPGIVMEGGSVEFNGRGSLLTSSCCLLNPNRNPQLSQAQIETYLWQFYGVEQVLWIHEGIEGDDTDGHVDDTVRFVNADTVLAVVEHRKSDANYEPLQRNLRDLQQLRLPDGRGLHIQELPMPDPVYHEGQRLPASYANFYICNRSVLVPTYRCDQDEVALERIAACFPGREVIGIDSTDIVWGLGSFHCLSQQEPRVAKG